MIQTIRIACVNASMQEQLSRHQDAKRDRCGWLTVGERRLFQVWKLLKDFAAKLMCSNLCFMKLLRLINGDLFEMVKKSNEDNRREAIASVQSKIMMIVHWRKWRYLKYTLYVKLTGLAVGFHLRWWRGKIKNEENWSGQICLRGRK